MPRQSAPSKAETRPAGLRSSAATGGSGPPSRIPEVEALGLVETDTVARGVVVADGVLKDLPVDLPVILVKEPAFYKIRIKPYM